MLRVTIELVPFGVEEMSKTISEFCIANVSGATKPNDVADYVGAGYLVRTDNKIEEFSVNLNYFPRNDGVLSLIKQLLENGVTPFDETEEASKETAERLLAKTRLAQIPEGETNEV